MTDTTLIRRALEAAGYTMTDKGTSYEGTRWYFTLYGPCIDPRGYIGIGKNKDEGMDCAWRLFLLDIHIVKGLIAAAFVELDEACALERADCTWVAEWRYRDGRIHTDGTPSRLEAMAAAIVAAKEGE